MAARTKTAEKPTDEAPSPVAEKPRDTRKRAVRVRASVLRGALKDVAGAVAGSGNTIPILSHVLFSARDGRIELVGTDLDVWAERACVSDDRDGPGSAEWVQSIRGFTVTLPAGPLGAILAEFDADAMVTVSLETDAETDEPAEGWKGQATIAAGRARFKLHCLPAGDFPLPKGFGAQAAFELSCAQLAGAFARVEHAISNEETRYYLNGVLLHLHQVEGEPLDLRLAATDGNRLARLRLDAPDGAASLPPAIVPRKTVALLDKLLSSGAKSEEKDKPAPMVLVEHAGGEAGALMRFSLPAADGGEITVTAKAIDGTFPDYQRVIPTDAPHSAVMGRAALAEAVKRVAVLASDKTRAVKARFSPDMLELVVTRPELGEAREELPCLYEGPDITIGFNGHYWHDALTALACEDVALAFDASDCEPLITPVLVRAVGEGVDRDALVQVLMPMRVG